MVRKFLYPNIKQIQKIYNSEIDYNRVFKLFTLWLYAVVFHLEELNSYIINIKMWNYKYEKKFKSSSGYLVTLILLIVEL